MPSFWWWFLQIHGGPAVGDGNILLWGMFEHSYHFKSQIDLDLDRSIRCIFFWVGASGKTGYIYIYPPNMWRGPVKNGWRMEPFPKSRLRWEVSGYLDQHLAARRYAEAPFFCRKNQWTWLEKRQNLLWFHRFFTVWGGVDQVNQLQELISVTHLIFSQIVKDFVYHHILPIHVQ